MLECTFVSRVVGAPPSMHCNEAPSSMHPLSERAARWRGPFTVNWPWQSLIESRFLSQLPSLPPRPQESLPLLLLLHLSFTSSDWHVQSMCLLFPAWEVSVPFVSPLSILFISSLSFSLRLTTFSPTTGWRYLSRSAESCLHPFSFTRCIPVFPVFLCILRRMKMSVAHDCFLSHFFGLWFWHHMCFFLCSSKGKPLILSLKEQTIHFEFLSITNMYPVLPFKHEGTCRV